MPSNNGLPRGWRKRSIGDVAIVRFSGVDKKSLPDETPVRLCNYMEVWKNPYIRDDMPFMEATATQNEIAHFTLKKHDVLITKDSETKGEIAQASVVRDDLRGVVLGYHLALIRPSSIEAYGPFIAAQLNEPQFRAQLVRIAAGATRYGVGIDEVRRATLWLPDVQVQRRIAGALRAVNDALDQTKRVIGQTRRLKGATLQTLLSQGSPRRRTRFRQVRLGDVFEERCEKGHAGLPIVSVTIHSGLVPRKNLERRLETELKAEQHLLVRTGDIAYNMMRMWQGVSGVAHHDCVVSPAYVVVRPKDGIVSAFAGYLFKSQTTIRLFHRFSQGLVDDRLRLYFDQFKSIPVRIPQSTDDQHHIAAILSSFDDRIRTERTKLDQLTRSRDALSHALLTGRVRFRKAMAT